jgi:hypothetical protein
MRLQAKHRFHTSICWLTMATCLIVSLAANSQAKEPITPTDGPINLLADNLGKLYSWLKESQYEDPKGVYSMQDGMLRISGDGWGGLTSKDEYTNYHMVMDFKWGEITWAPREDRSRDSGILVHCVGPDGGYSDTWMASIEAQIIEGGTGDFLVLQGFHKDGSAVNPKPSLTAEVGKDRDGETIWKKGGENKTVVSGRINWYGRDPDWKDVLGFRGKQDVSSPTGEWNRYEVICDGDKITAILNGVVDNEGFDAAPTAGKVIVQSEGAEMFVRRWQLWPLGKAPKFSQADLKE